MQLTKKHKIHADKHK